MTPSHWCNQQDFSAVRIPSQRVVVLFNPTPCLLSQVRDALGQMYINLKISNFAANFISHHLTHLSSVSTMMRISPSLTSVVRFNNRWHHGMFTIRDGRCASGRGLQIDDTGACNTGFIPIQGTAGDLMRGLGWS